MLTSHIQERLGALLRCRAVEPLSVCLEREQGVEQAPGRDGGTIAGRRLWSGQRDRVGQQELVQAAAPVRCAQRELCHRLWSAL